MGTDNEVEYFRVLKRIAKGYRPVEWFEKNSERAWGLSPQEALAMAYENIKYEAATAIQGKLTPKRKSKT